tara:strand:- start:54036 stop:54422 length:387 start_codon:yes stop_codon:yes gene_type:complete
VNALEETFIQSKKYEIPMREQGIIVTNEGYYPKSISIFEGEKIRFFITSTMNEKSCFMIPEKEIFISAQKGLLSEAEAVFNKAGTYKFYCPTGKIKGQIVVLKKKAKTKKARRKIASESVMIWMPKEK